MNRKQRKTLSQNWGIKRTCEGKYVIIDTVNGIIVNDSNGKGYRTYYSAYCNGYKIFHGKGKCSGEPNTDEFNTLI